MFYAVLILILAGYALKKNEAFFALVCLIISIVIATGHLK